MRPRTVAILLTALARAAAAARQRRRHVAVTVLAGLVLGGCSPALTRPPVTQQELLTLRTKGDEQATAASREIFGRLLERTKPRHNYRYISAEIN
jgi:hypothetical protein